MFNRSDGIIEGLGNEGVTGLMALYLSCSRLCEQTHIGIREKKSTCKFSSSLLPLFRASATRNWACRTRRLEANVCGALNRANTYKLQAPLWINPWAAAVVSGEGGQMESSEEFMQKVRKTSREIAQNHLWYYHQSISFL